MCHDESESMLFCTRIHLARYGPNKGRGPLLSKFAPIGFYKGFGAVGLGRHTKKGFFLINKTLIPNIHVPKEINPELKPYISPKTPIEVKFKHRIH